MHIILFSIILSWTTYNECGKIYYRLMLYGGMKDGRKALFK
mgnify:FL=1